MKHEGLNFNEMKRFEDCLGVYKTLFGDSYLDIFSRIYNKITPKEFLKRVQAREAILANLKKVDHLKQYNFYTGKFANPFEAVYISHPKYARLKPLLLQKFKKSRSPVNLIDFGAGFSQSLIGLVTSEPILKNMLLENQLFLTRTNLTKAYDDENKAKPDFFQNFQSISFNSSTLIGDDYKLFENELCNIPNKIIISHYGPFYHAPMPAEHLLRAVMSMKKGDMYIILPAKVKDPKSGSKIYLEANICLSVLREKSLINGNVIVFSAKDNQGNYIFPQNPTNEESENKAIEITRI